MLKPRHAQRGVTLIELMIGLVVVAVLLGLGIPSFRTFIQNTHIRNGVEAIQNGLDLAKAEAVRRNTNIRFILGNGASWTVACATAVGDTDEDGVPDCPGTTPAATTPAFIQARSEAESAGKTSVAATEVVASTGLIASSPVFTNTLNFNGLGRVTTLPPGNIAVFDVSNPAGGTCAKDGGEMRCMRVVVTSAGQIRMCDPARSDTADPQAC